MAVLPKLYNEGYEHARFDATCSLEHRIKSLHGNMRYSPVAEQRILKRIVDVLQMEHDYIAKLKMTPDERNERNAEAGAK